MRRMSVLLILACLIASLPNAWAATPEPDLAARDFAIAGAGVTQFPVQLFNIWGLKFTAGANSRSLTAIQGGANGSVLSLLINTTADPKQLRADLYLDTDRDPTTGLTPLFMAGPGLSKPFGDDLGADYVVHISGTNNWVERIRDHANVGTALSSTQGQQLRLDIATGLIQVLGDGSVNFGLGVFSDMQMEFVPSMSEYNASPYAVKTRALHLFSTGLVTIIPGNGTVVRHGHRNNLGKLNSPSVANVTVSLESTPVEILAIKYIMDGQDISSGVASLNPTKEVMATFDDDFSLYPYYSDGLVLNFAYPDTLVPGQHTFTVVFMTDRGDFARTVQWFVRTVYGPGDIVP